MYLHSPKLFVIIFFVSLIILPFVAPLSFNFSSFSPDDQRIKYEGPASPENNVIQLTRDITEIARATYAKPIQIWDNSTRHMANFNSHFSFVMDSQHRAIYSSGLTFFLAPNGSRIPDGTIAGYTLGLTSDNEPLNSTDNPFVAVEFDIFPSAIWDAPHEHVGIDINSMKSVKKIAWHPSIPDGRQNDAWISYDSSSKNLSIIFTGFASDNITVIQQGLYFVVDLREHLPEWVTVGFSAATSWQPTTQSIQSWNFNSTDLPLAHETGPSGSNRRMMVGLAVGGSVLVSCLGLGLGLGLFGFWRKRMRENEGDDCDLEAKMVDELERGTGPKKFAYEELSRATNNFAEEHKLGEGGFGGVYRGFLRELNSQVAVKRVSRGSKQGIKEYASEVRIISRLRHRNLVQLIGWCHERRQLLLVYEFMPNGSLDCHLFQENGLLKWAERYKIAQGLASALLYLQEEWEQCVVHRDIKSSNVMLDSNFNAKLGDFGLARLVDHEKGLHTTILAGTIGYVAPECIASRKSSKESDVFSFGVVALEIACGRRPINNNAPENQVILVEWVWELYEMGKLLEATDLKLCANFNEQEMERLMIVGLWCAHPNSKLRPSIRQVIQVLKFESPLPDLPPVMSLATYLAPPRTNDGSAVASESNQIHYSKHTNSSSAASISYSSVLFPR